MWKKLIMKDVVKVYYWNDVLGVNFNTRSMWWQIVMRSHKNMPEDYYEKSGEIYSGYDVLGVKNHVENVLGFC